MFIKKGLLFQEGGDYNGNSRWNVTFWSLLIVLIECEGVVMSTTFVTEETEDVLELTGYNGEEPTGVLVIPEGVTEIGSHAFDGCTGLTSVVIPSNVKKIRDGAFSGCTGLTSVVISEGAHSRFRKNSSAPRAFPLKC